MNELGFPLKIFERDTDDICILVDHDARYVWGDAKKQDKERKDQTRKFCNWIRKTFPHVPTEFRYCGTKEVWYNRGRWNRRRVIVNSDKHFVAYGLKRNELMMIKLAWIYKTIPCRLKGTSHPDPNAYAIDAPQGFRPTDALKARIENKTKVKPVKVDD